MYTIYAHLNRIFLRNDKFQKNFTQRFATKEEKAINVLKCEWIYA